MTGNNQIETLKKPNTYRKYDAVLTRFDEQFPGRELQQISIEELNEFVIKLRKSGLSANTVLHNVIIIAQFCRRNGRPNLTRELHLPEAIHFLPKVYSENSSHVSWRHAIPGSVLYFRRSCLRDSGSRK
jgi:site-specific recombinase XerC